MRKSLTRLVKVLLAATAGLWIAVQFMSQAAPEGLGVHGGSLSDCPRTPNCVCSDCEESEKMAPIVFRGDPARAQSTLKAILQQNGISIVEEKDNYLHAVATTPLMRFKDDLEFLIRPDEKKIHFRSASRLGKSDLGKNRSRMDKIVAALKSAAI